MVFTKIIEDVFSAVNDYREIHSVYITGSRLYGFNKSNSDYDVKVYVFPSLEDIALNRMVSKEINYNGEYVESLDLKDYRYQYKELAKPSFGSLHLLATPIWGNSLIDSEITEKAFNGNKKNLILSMLGTFRSRQKSEELKDYSHLIFLYETSIVFSREYICFNYFNTIEAKNISNLAMQVRNGNQFDKEGIIEKADYLFEQTKGIKRNLSDNAESEIISQIIQQLVSKS